MRIALFLEYDGSGFHGWQYQPNLRTVQGELEKALAKIADTPIQTFCAGRTDKGVHAKYQVIHFDTLADRPMSAWVLGTNHFLSKDMSVRYAQEVSEAFHARYSALSRTYEYWIDNRPTHPAIKRHHVTWFPRPLDQMRMHEATQYLVGEHNFNAFRAAECQAQHPIRHIYHIALTREDHYIVLTVTANAFLHHMVRNIVGTLLPIGWNEKPVEWIKEVLQAKKRAHAGVTAPAEGLYLTKVNYPPNLLEPAQCLLV